MENAIQEKTSNINTSFFESKEHYLNFKQAWKQSIAEGYHVPFTYENPVNGGIEKFPSKLTCVHHLIYNALRGQDLKKSFRPLTRPGRLNNVSRDWRLYGLRPENVPYAAYYMAFRSLRTWVEQDKLCAKLQEPFKGTVSREMLNELVKVLSSINM